MTRFGTSMEEYRTAEVKKIDAEAEAVRQSIITAGAGQAMAYDEKLREAEHFMGPDGGPEANYLHLVAEAAAEIPPVTVQAKAMQIIETAQVWRVISSRIEALRIGRKVEIQQATTPTQLRNLPPVNWISVFTNG